jgi:hypothetical protein
MIWLNRTAGGGWLRVARLGLHRAVAGGGVTLGGAGDGIGASGAVMTGSSVGVLVHRGCGGISLGKARGCRSLGDGGGSSLGDGGGAGSGSLGGSSLVSTTTGSLGGSLGGGASGG